MPFVFKRLALLMSIAAVVGANKAIPAEKEHRKFEIGPAASYPAHQTSEKVTIGAAAYDAPGQARTAFGKLNPYEQGILPVLVENRNGYKNLCELLTQAHLRSEKGKCAVRWNEIPQFAEGLVALLGSACDSRVPYGDSPDGLLRNRESLRRVAANGTCAARKEILQREAVIGNRAKPIRAISRARAAKAGVL